MTKFQKALNYLNNEKVKWILYGDVEKPDKYWYIFFSRYTIPFKKGTLKSPKYRKESLLKGLKEFLEETETKENEKIFLKFYVGNKFSRKYIVKIDEIKEFKIKNGIVIKQ